ncbi:hypothetical protein C1645_833393 [Glomus cerebriforme]|uniref:F-box domain-containing protein n=1 Tax=Glomus cerebriforme TaxID=658196 RepID=A0A397SLK7_9GLOM|nr:hypothetical protein C1645_833393 [Glomus cerebriforme]
MKRVLEGPDRTTATLEFLFYSSKLRPMGDGNKSLIDAISSLTVAINSLNRLVEDKDKKDKPESLKLIGGTPIPQQSLINFLVINSSLQEIDIGAHFHRAKNKELLPLITNKVLKLWDAKNISNEGVEMLAKSCPNLESLSILYAQINDKALHHLLKYCPYLEEIDLYGCGNISNMGLKLLASEIILSIDLCGCFLINNEGIRELVNNCPKLIALRISYCQDADLPLI